MQTVAVEVVAAYEMHVQLHELADPVEVMYTVGPYQPSGSVTKEFENAGHPCYDTKSFRPDELEVAKALDKLTSVALPIYLQL